ncbi:phosphoribosylamine--glycine ligase [Blattabacterium cuenoti]|uniref:phosphoribosylamine--glycine ligase n=1 Tax=Blattabacterium cuenoti TaxID=1653831 RepID=UPI00163C50C1|nr:phosphoribosylamine--glycine ligase [Blattabacterium cuenoti]
MKILILGNGGREHAIGKKILKDNPFVRLYFYPGNGGTNLIGINIGNYINDYSMLELALFSKKNNIDLTIVGSEVFLMKKIVDIFHSYGLRIIGPNYLSARLEGDRGFSKFFMKKYGIRTPNYEIFHCYDDAINYLDKKKFPLVIKTNGIASGKGVLLTNNKKEAKKAIREIMIEKKFGKSGEKIIIENFLQGEEASIITIFNGKYITPFISSKDYKKIGENEIGLNTGGMGAISPHPHMNNLIWMDFKKNILDPTYEGLISEKLIFFGFIYFGLMITCEKVYLLEYNTRMGDPETQTLLPLMKNNFLNIITSFDKIDMFWEQLYSCCIVLSSKGYPKKYEIGKIISGINSLKEPFYISGAKKQEEKWVTTSGRVINIIGLGNTINESIKIAYKNAKKIKFDNLYFRKDIGS